MSGSNSTQKTGAKRGPKRAVRSIESDDKSATTNNGHDQPGTSTSTVTDGNPYLIPLSLLNPYITCSLCDGYFIDAGSFLTHVHIKNSKQCFSDCNGLPSHILQKLSHQVF